MSSTTPLSLSKVSRNSAGALLTPNKTIPPQVTESPGNWQHPRMKEITHRQNATVFTAQNVRAIVYNLAAILIIHLMRISNAEFGPTQLQVHLNRVLQPTQTNGALQEHCPSETICLLGFHGCTGASPAEYWTGLSATRAIEG